MRVRLWLGLAALALVHCDTPVVGDTGNSGDSGDTADSGDTGDTGNTGDTANSGDTGDTGDTGVGTVELPDQINVGTVDCGGTETATFDVLNPGPGDFVYTISSSAPSIFSVTPAAGTVLAETTTTFTLSAVVPATLDAGVAVVGTITVEASGAAPVTIPVTVLPRGGTISLDPSSVTFGDVTVGSPAIATVVIANDGNAPVDVAVSAPGGAFAVSFAGGALAAQADSEATFTFAPEQPGFVQASALLTVTGVTCGVLPAAISLSGQGTDTGAVLVTGDGDFGTVGCGDAGETRTITLRNTGSFPAAWSAALLADADGDGAFYDIAPTSGTVDPGTSAELTLTRLVIPLPATPRAYDVTLRVSVAGADHDVEVHQLLEGVVLEVSEDSFDFGFAPLGVTLDYPLSITNTGNVAAGVSVAVAEPFSAPAGATTLLPGAELTLPVSYSPSALGSAQQDLLVTAPGVCHAPRSVTLLGGDGPWAVIGDLLVEGTCGAAIEQSAMVSVANLGTEALEVGGCAELVGTDIAPLFSPEPLPVSPGDSEALTCNWSLSAPLRSGMTSTQVRCDTNEKYFRIRTFELVRAIYGADLLLAPETSFEITCSETSGTEWHLRVTNVGNVSAFLVGDINVPPPFYGITGSFDLGPGGAVNTQLGIGMGSGGACIPGSGFIGVFTGSAAVCSATPGTSLPINLLP